MTEVVLFHHALGLTPGVVAFAEELRGAGHTVTTTGRSRAWKFAPGWPDGVPVQVHGMDADPIFAGEGDLDAARALVESTERAELFLYEGDQHYFADSTLPSYDPEAAALLTAAHARVPGHDRRVRALSLCRRQGESRE